MKSNEMLPNDMQEAIAWQPQLAASEIWVTGKGWNHIGKMKNHVLNSIAHISNTPCVTISMNTPGYQFDNSQFKTELERLLNQAKFLVLEKYAITQLPANPILERLDILSREISFEDHFKSLNIFLSETICETVFSIWPVAHNWVQVSDRFDIRPLVAIVNNTEEYHILLLSHKKVRIFYAVNNEVLHEVKNGTFPITENLDFLRHSSKIANTKEEIGPHHFLSTIDKALIKLYNNTGIRYVVVGSKDNYEHLIKVAIFPSLYIGLTPISNDLRRSTIALGAWGLIQVLQKHNRCQSMRFMQELITEGRALTHTGAILEASKEGRGDLLIINEDIELSEKEEEQISEAVWNIINKDGRVLLTRQEEVESMESHALKLKY